MTSKKGLLAAAGPDALIVASTEKVRKAFSGKAGEWDVVTDFTPDVTIPLGGPPLRHVAFSTGGDFMVVSAEERGGLGVFGVSDVLAGKQQPEHQIQTDNVAVRSLLPNPAENHEQYMAVVLDSGKLLIADINNNATKTLRDDSVYCATWSNRGRAVAAGLQDGTTVIYMSDGTIKGIIPSPPDVDADFQGKLMSILCAHRHSC